MINATVSVVTITYGHEKYIADAIDGILRQECDFNFEIIIANDNSPDNTDEVIANYLAKKTIPNNISIKYTKHKQNKGMIPNFIWALEQANGKYIALCEGDDYWIDPLKLQKQVNFLETNESYSACVSNRKFKDHFTQEEFISDYKQTISLEDILGGIIPPTQCFLYRNNSFFINFSKFGNYQSGDRMLSYLIAQKGLIHCIKDVTAVYNYTGTGAWSKFNTDDKKIVATIDLKHFHDLLHLPAGNTYIMPSLYSIIRDREQGIISISDSEFIKKFGLSKRQLLLLKLKAKLSLLKYRFIQS